MGTPPSPHPEDFFDRPCQMMSFQWLAILVLRSTELHLQAAGDPCLICKQGDFLNELLSAKGACYQRFLSGPLSDWRYIIGL